MDRYTTHLADLRSRFEASYRRPFPWFDIIDDEAAAFVWSTLAQALGHPLVAPDHGVLRIALDRLALNPKDSCWGLPNSDALATVLRRHSLATDAAVYLSDGRSDMLVQLSLSDLLDFEPVLYAENTWVIDESCRWIAYAAHDYPAYVLPLNGHPTTRRLQ